MKKIISWFWQKIPKSIQIWVSFLLNPKFNVGVVGIIFNPKNEVLVVKHVLRNKTNWGFVGGFKERDETAEAALAREIKEEVGLTLNSFELLLCHSSHKYRVEIVFVGKTTETMVTPSTSLELFDAEFVDPQNCPYELLERERQYLAFALNSKILVQ